MGGDAVLIDDRWAPEALCEYYTFLKQVGKHLLIHSSDQVSDLDDFVQIVLMQMYKKKNSLNNHPNIKGWLVIALKNELAANRRIKFKKNKWGYLSLDSSYSDNLQKALTNTSLNPEFIFVDQYPERLEKIKQIIGNEDAELLVETYVEGLPASVVASRRGMSEGALKMKVYRLKNKIRCRPELFLSLFLYTLLLYK